MSRRAMQETWDAAARSGSEAAIGKTVQVAEQVEEIFSLLGRPARGDGLCLDVGCGIGRMTAELARRWPEVLGVDVSPQMLARAEQLGLPNARFALVSGTRLDGVADGCAETLVCYGVLQHLPRRRLVSTYLAEFARTLAPTGQAVVHLPVLQSGLRPRLWRLLRMVSTAVRGRLSRNFTAKAAYRGTRLNERELDRSLLEAGLRIQTRAELASYFGFAANVLLLLVHGP